jgi:dethiobiotin synthetase
MMRFKGFFITGTDTEVGKTLIAGALILQLQSKGMKAVGYKPVAAGLREVNGNLINEDVQTLLMVSQQIAPHLGANDICPFILKEAAAPHIVAEQNAIKLDMDAMIRQYQSLQDSFDAVIVEGAGGFLVPINEQSTLGDFAQAIQLPVILVVSIKLGCINHALLTAEAIARRGLKLNGWIANCIAADSGFNQQNITTIDRMLQHQYQTKLLGIIPQLSTCMSLGLYSLENLQRATQLIHLDL